MDSQEPSPLFSSSGGSPIHNDSISLAAVRIQRSYRRSVSRRSSSVVLGEDFETSISNPDTSSLLENPRLDALDTPGATRRARTDSAPPVDRTPDLIEASESEEDASENDDSDFVGSNASLLSNEGEDEDDEKKKKKRRFMWGVAGGAAFLIGGTILHQTMGGSPVDEDDIAAIAVAGKTGGGAGGAGAGGVSGSITYGSGAGVGASSSQ